LKTTLGKEELEALASAKSFKFFCKIAWQYVSSSELIWNWHCDAIVDHLQAVYDGRICNLIINIPPGHAKSLFVSVLFPAWVWINRPEIRFITASHSIQLSERDTVLSRDLMKSDWYKRFFRSVDSPFLNNKDWDFSEGQDLKGYFKNTRLGHRVAQSVSGAGTGYRADYLIMDDLLDVGNANNVAALEAIQPWYGKMATRCDNIKKYRKILVMQRLHANDPTGMLLRNGGYCHLSLPSEFVVDKRCITHTDDGKEFWRDPRTYEGELLFPAKFPKEDLDEMKSMRGVGPVQYLGQYQQAPFDQSGGIIKLEWLNRRYTYPGEYKESRYENVPLPQDGFDTHSIFCDATFKANSKSDRVAIGVFGTKGTNHFLLDIAWDRMTFTETLKAIVSLKSKWPEVNGIYIEDRANGSAIIDALRGKLSGIIEVQPQGGKEARVSAASQYICAGNLILPQTSWYVDDLIHECVSFPKGRFDDGVDMLSYAMIHLSRLSSFEWLKAMGE
jgi:predicted phage terminase large subunit-like protein